MKKKILYAFVLGTLFPLAASEVLCAKIAPLKAKTKGSSQTAVDKLFADIHSLSPTHTRNVDISALYGPEGTGVKTFASLSGGSVSGKAGSETLTIKGIKIDQGGTDKGIWNASVTESKSGLSGKFTGTEVSGVTKTPVTVNFTSSSKSTKGTVVKGKKTQNFTNPDKVDAIVGELSSQLM